jgi:hypothetical protein
MFIDQMRSIVRGVFFFLSSLTLAALSIIQFFVKECVICAAHETCFCFVGRRGVFMCLIWPEDHVGMHGCIALIY